MLSDVLGIHIKEKWILLTHDGKADVHHVFSQRYCDSQRYCAHLSFSVCLTWHGVSHSKAIILSFMFCLFLQAGSVQVRVRRDADEQLVLAHVYSRLSNIVSNLTVQIFKDDWTRASSFNLMGNPAFSQNYTQIPSTYTSTLPSSRGPSPTQDLSHAAPMGASFKPVLLPQQFRDYQSTDQSNYSFQTGSHSHGPSYQIGQSHSHSHGVPKQH